MNPTITIVIVIMMLFVVSWLVGYFRRAWKLWVSVHGTWQKPGLVALAAQHREAERQHRDAEKQYRTAAQHGDDEQRQQLEDQAAEEARKAAGQGKLASQEEQQASEARHGYMMMVGVWLLMLGVSLVCLFIALISGLSFASTIGDGLADSEPSNGWSGTALFVLGAFAVLGFFVIPWVADEYASNPPRKVSPEPVSDVSLNPKQLELYRKYAKKTNRRSWYNPFRQPMALVALAVLWGIIAGSSFGLMMVS